jgi:hypothetical protein
MSIVSERSLRSEAIAVLQELVRKDATGTYLGHTNFNPERDAEKVATFVNTYIAKLVPQKD